MVAPHEESVIRDYVERELDRTIRLTHPELGIREGTRWTAGTAEANARRRFWTIEAPSRFGVADYIIEVRLSDHELLIWFGFSSAGALSTTHLIRPAVHLDLNDLMSTRSQRRDDVSLGAVLERMLKFRDDEPSIRFPMNYRTLT
ncbi:MAG: hypothetical protein OER90_17445 [Gemmatimonadota bacterium]|nr:hypothetical protein [Gemmatimonadota bacterium]